MNSFSLNENKNELQRDPRELYFSDLFAYCGSRDCVMGAGGIGDKDPDSSYSAVSYTCHCGNDCQDTIRRVYLYGATCGSCVPYTPNKGNKENAERIKKRLIDQFPDMYDRTTQKFLLEW